MPPQASFEIKGLTPIVTPNENFYRIDKAVTVPGFTAGFPLRAALDGRPALIAVGMNGKPLPLVHGYPARLAPLRGIREVEVRVDERPWRRAELSAPVSD